MTIENDGSTTQRSDQPVSWHDFNDTRTLTDHLQRWRELTWRDLSARAVGSLRARGEFDPERHSSLLRDKPLNVAEHLEILATGEAIARQVRHLSDVHRAVQTGATWAQVAHAVGQDEQQIRDAYRRWADGQRELHKTYGGAVGLTEAEHADALAMLREGLDD